MKKTLTMLLAGASLAALASPAMAIEGLTANAAITTDYVSRGITQSSSNPAVQAGLDYTLGDTGFAVGLWTSSVNFGDDPTFELDTYASYSGTVGAFGYTAGVIAYLYPNQGSASAAIDSLNTYEVFGGLSYDFGFASLAGKIYYNPDVPFSGGENLVYYSGAVTVPLGPWLSAVGGIGYSDYGVTPSVDYTDWNVGLAATFDAYTISATYYDADTAGVKEKIVGAISFKLQ